MGFLYFNFNNTVPSRCSSLFAYFDMFFLISSASVLKSRDWTHTKRYEIFHLYNLQPVGWSNDRNIITLFPSLSYNTLRFFADFFCIIYIPVSL